MLIKHVFKLEYRHTFVLFRKFPTERRVERTALNVLLLSISKMACFKSIRGSATSWKWEKDFFRTSKCKIHFDISIFEKSNHLEPNISVSNHLKSNHFEFLNTKNSNIFLQWITFYIQHLKNYKLIKTECHFESSFLTSFKF